MPKGRKVNQGVKLLFIRDYIFKNSDKNHAVKAKEVIEYLKAHGISEDIKTFYKDIQRLTEYYRKDEHIKGEIGDDEFIYYDKHLHGYVMNYYQFTPRQLSLMIDSVQSSMFISDAESELLTKKIKELGSEKHHKELSRRSYVENRVGSMSESVINNADKLHEAIRSDLQVKFRFFHYQPTTDAKREHIKQYSKKGEPYLVSPFALYWNNGFYYLYAFVEDKNEFRYFRVDRMERITIQPSLKRLGKEQFDASQVLLGKKAKVFDMYRGEKCNVQIRCRNNLTDVVIDQFGKEIMLVSTDKEHFRFTATVELSPTFYAWIATFGRYIKIIGPQKAIDGMKDFLKKVNDVYKDDGEM